MSSAKASLLKKMPIKPQKDGGRYEFIPYHSHYNPHTLITKNGELLQIIKIDGNIQGQLCENADGIHESVRETIRQVMTIGEITTKFSFWLHTIRRYSPINYKHTTNNPEFADSFAGYVNSRWEKNHKWDREYYNEVYLTIMHDGQQTPIFDKKKNIMIPAFNRRFRGAYLENAYEDLELLTNEIIEGIKTQIAARKLGLDERYFDSNNTALPTIFYSEMMEFLGNIINLREESFPLPDVDLSVGLQSSELSFSFDAVESKSNQNGKKRFGTLLNLKQFCEMPIDSVDCVMQAPIEFIASQCFSFIPSERALKHYKSQKDFFDLSGDKKSIEDFGVKLMLESDQKRDTDFCENQTSFMILADTAEELIINTGKFQNLFATLGLVLLREDIRMQEAFWAQLPGNFEFLRRLNSIAIDKVAGFCRLNRFPSGVADGNHWGPCVVQLPTSVGSSYFFNFHVGSNGHTVLFDFNSFGDRASRILEYFLLTQTRKFPARLIVFDRDQSARLLFNKLEGSYFPMTQLLKASRERLEDKSPKLALNPFTLENSRYNQSFLVAWCGLLISPDVPLDDDSKGLIREAVIKLYEMPLEKRTLPTMALILSESNSELARPLEQWIGRGEYAGLFDFASDNLDASSAMLGVDFTVAFARSAFSLPLFSYLMHRIIDDISGEPTIIVINEAFDFLENAFFAPRLESLLDMLREKNVMVLFTTSTPNSCLQTQVFSAIMAGTATQIYVPDEIPIKYHELGLDLNNQDALMLLNMDRQKGDFLLKQEGESISLKMFISDSEDAIAILMNDIKGLSAAHGKFASIPKDY